MRPSGRQGLLQGLRASAPGLGLLAGIVALASPLACDGTIEGDGADPNEVRSGALRNPNDPNGPLDFKYWVQTVPLGLTSLEPAITNGGPHLYIAMQRGTNGRYWGISAEGPQNGTWGKYEPDDSFPRLFASSPAVAHLPDSGMEKRVMVVGRGQGSGLDTRIFWSRGKVVQDSPPSFKHPEKITNFAAVSNDQFTGSFGFPAVTSTPSGTVILAYVGPFGTNQQRVYVQRRPASPMNPGWSTRVASPAIPGPFTTVQTPAITYGYPFVFEPILGTIAIRTISGSTSRVFRIFTDGVAFHDAWIEMTPFETTPPDQPINSNIAIEWNDELLTHTLYFRSGTSIFQSSFFYNYWSGPFRAVTAPGAVPSFTGAPAVTGNVQYEHGKHWVLGRDSGTGRLWFSESFPDSEMIE